MWSGGKLGYVLHFLVSPMTSDVQKTAAIAEKLGLFRLAGVAV